MTEDVKITNPVKIVPDSPQRVAFDLMIHVSALDNVSEVQKKDRKYWLSLYS